MSMSSLKFENYIVEKVDFEINLEYSGRDTEIDMNLDKHNEINENQFATILDLELFPKAEEKDYPFNMKVRLIGIFTVEKDENENIKESYIEKNSITILYPYLRALVSTYTSNSNVGTTILPPINVIKYLEEKNNKL